jgi:hypothetical protein
MNASDRVSVDVSESVRTIEDVHLPYGGPPRLAVEPRGALAGARAEDDDEQRKRTKAYSPIQHGLDSPFCKGSRFREPRQKSSHFNVECVTRPIDSAGRNRMTTFGIHPCYHGRLQLHLGRAEFRLEPSHDQAHFTFSTSHKIAFVLAGPQPGRWNRLHAADMRGQANQFRVFSCR